MLYSGNTYLQQQAKAVIERSGSFLNQTTGQLPHHFVNDKPTYLALSGATQTGPNIELDDDDESNKGRRGSMFTGRAGNETDSPTETIDSSNPQSDTGSIQMSLKENKNKKKVKGFADQKHKSHRLKNLEEKRRKRFFKMKSNMRD